ncbi:MAG: hypothetical protein WB249_13715 [Candidatus Sulfotelmatobacter sp.]
MSNPGPAANVEQTVPAPPTFNETNTITSTQQMLENELQPESAQQGQPAQNSVVSISAGLPASALQTFTWE